MDNHSQELILLIERAGKSGVDFEAALGRKGFMVELASTGQQALKRAAKSSPAVIVLNAASLGSNGLRICQRIKNSVNGVPLIHILDEEDDANAPKSSADVVLVLPFTPRKLINRVKRLLPGERTDALEVGSIRFSPKARIVEAYGREKRLTPKAAKLLELFLSNPGKILDRSFLMRKVWQTDYVGDTRTLDVHIRWVRKAVERDPASPQHVVTVRGRGYCFEPSPRQADNKAKKKK